MVMVKIAFIYRIINLITNQIYIGQCVDIKSRLRRYKNNHCKEQKLIYGSISKYKWENHKFEIIKTLNNVSEEEINKTETYYIELYKSWWYDYPETGLNILKYHNSRKNIPHSDYTKNLISKKLIGRNLTEETKRKISTLFKGNRPNQVKIYQFDLNGNFIKEYNSIVEASENTGICMHSIQSCSIGKYKRGGKFYWSRSIDNNKYKKDEFE